MSKYFTVMSKNDFLDIISFLLVGLFLALLINQLTLHLDNLNYDGIRIAYNLFRSIYELRVSINPYNIYNLGF